MLSDEEKKSIEDVKEMIELYKDGCLITTEDDFKSIEILLNLIEKKSKIIDGMIQEYEYNARINLKNFCEDEMRKDKCIQDCRICVRKYFEERCK